MPVGTFSANFISINSKKKKKKTGRGNTLQELQEQELQLPEQQLHEQGDIVMVVVVD